MYYNKFIKWLKKEKADYTLTMIAKLLNEMTIDELPPTLQRTIRPYIIRYKTQQINLLRAKKGVLNNEKSKNYKHSIY